LGEFHFYWPDILLRIPEKINRYFEVKSIWIYKCQERKNLAKWDMMIDRNIKFYVVIVDKNKVRFCSQWIKGSRLTFSRKKDGRLKVNMAEYDGIPIKEDKW